MSAAAFPSPDKSARPGAAGTGVLEQDLRLELPKRDPVPARIYRPEGGARPAAAPPLVLHFHGGTFTCGGLDEGRTVGHLLAESGAVVVSLAYPLAPKNPFPGAIELGIDALEWLHKQRTRLAGRGAALYLAGEEAGGNLAAGVAMMARDRGAPPVAGMVLLSPMLDPCAGTASLRAAQAPDSPCKWAAGWAKYLGRPADAMHPYAVPSASLRLAQLAPTLVLVGQNDAMRDEALAYAERLRGAGNKVCAVVLANEEQQWPESLTTSSSDTAECPCSAQVREQLRAFFAASAAGKTGKPSGAESPQPPG